MVKLLLHDLAATYVTVTRTCLHLYSKQQVHLRQWQAWHDEKPEIMCVREQTGQARSREGEQTMAERATSWKAQAHIVLDVRPELEQGGEPFVRIMEAASAINPGRMLVIVAPFEPVPLYAVLEAQGFAHETEQVAADEWVVCFSRSA
jgi:uncharacterized protein (DUF2249 family)